MSNRVRLTPNPAAHTSENFSIFQELYRLYNFTNAIVYGRIDNHFRLHDDIPLDFIYDKRKLLLDVLLIRRAKRDESVFTGILNFVRNVGQKLLALRRFNLPTIPVGDIF